MEEDKLLQHSDMELPATDMDTPLTPEDGKPNMHDVFFSPEADVLDESGENIVFSDSKRYRDRSRYENLHWIKLITGAGLDPNEATKLIGALEVMSQVNSQIDERAAKSGVDLGAQKGGRVRESSEEILQSYGLDPTKII